VISAGVGVVANGNIGDMCKNHLLTLTICRRSLSLDNKIMES